MKTGEITHTHTHTHTQKKLKKKKKTVEVYCQLEWSPIRSLIIQMIKKIGRPLSGYDFRQNWTTQSPVTN